MARIWRLLAEACIVRFHPALLHRLAVQHPVGIDATALAHWRLSARGEMALWLFQTQPALLAPYYPWSDFREPASTRRCRRVQGPDVEWGDVVQMRNGILEINGVAVKKERIADLIIPVTQNMRDAAEVDRNPFPCWRPDMEEPAADGGTQCRYPRFRETLPEGRSYEILDLANGLEGDNTEAFVVGEGDIFLMGDNRDRSADSRWSPIEKPGAIGMVPQENLVGRALVSVFSTDGSSHWLLPWTWFTATRAERIGQGF
jgi:hypothetical protein